MGIVGLGCVSPQQISFQVIFILFHLETHSVNPDNRRCGLRCRDETSQPELHHHHQGPRHLGLHPRQLLGQVESRALLTEIYINVEH